MTKAKPNKTKRYYFFHHPLKSKGEIPGRVSFDVIGNVLTPQKISRDQRIRLVADGLAHNKISTNQDPCVFAHPLNIVHAFCKINRTGGKYYVFSTKKVLSQEVKRDDVIFYGSIVTRKRKLSELFVDTVLVVDKHVNWPTTKIATRSKRQLCVKADEVKLLARLLGIKGKLSDTDLWRYCLSDARCNHKFTYVEPHRLILGKLSKKWFDIQSGMGSFVPLCGDCAKSPIEIGGDQNIKSGFEILFKSCERLCGPIKPPFLMDSNLGHRVLKAILNKSSYNRHQAVGIPPFRTAKQIRSPRKCFRKSRCNCKNVNSHSVGIHVSKTR